MMNLKLIEKLFILLLLGFSLCVVHACGDDDDDKFENVNNNNNNNDDDDDDDDDKGGSYDCVTCKGRGYCYFCNGDGVAATGRECSYCDGSGICHRCDGVGEIYY